MLTVVNINPSIYLNLLATGPGAGAIGAAAGSAAADDVAVAQALARPSDQHSVSRLSRRACVPGATRGAEDHGLSPSRTPARSSATLRSSSDESSASASDRRRLRPAAAVLEYPVHIQRMYIQHTECGVHRVTSISSAVARCFSWRAGG